MKLDYQTVVDLIEGSDFSWKIDRSRKTKIGLLNRIGYSTLKGKGKDNRIHLQDCSTSMLTGALRNIYNTAVRGYDEKVRSGDSYETISSLLRSEEVLEGDELEDAMERTAIVLADASDIELKLLSVEFGKKLGGFYRGK